MTKLTWSDDLSVGVEQIDTQHKELIRIANGLINAVALGRGRKTTDNVLRRLREYTVFHFNSEEALMEKVHYPGRGEHAREHLGLKNNVKEFQRTLYIKEKITPGDVLSFLKIWLLKHILSADMDLANFIRSQKEHKG